MPGDLIKLFDSQADWQSGSLENLDAVTTPGLIIPTGDYSKVYDSQADWDTGSKSDVVSSVQNDISLGDVTPDWTTFTVTASSESGIGTEAEKAVDGNTGTYWAGDTYRNEWLKFDYGDGVSRTITRLRLYLNQYSEGQVKDFRLEGSDNGTSWNTLVTGTTVLATGWQEWDVASPHAYRYYRLYCVNNHFMVPSHMELDELEFVLRTEYEPSGTWTSAWLAHGIVSPQSGFLSLVKEAPAGTAVTPHARYSSDGGSTYTDWTELTNARLPGLTGTHVQVRLTLTTDDPPSTPVVSKATLLVGSMHRWTSPAIDLAGVEEDATLMLPTSQTELDVVREIREYPNFTFARNSTAYNPETGAEVAVNEPRYVEGPWAGSKALYVEEGTENHSLNPRFATTGNWVLGKSPGSTATFTTDGTWGKITIPSEEIGAGYHYYVRQTRDIAVPANTPATFSVYFKNDHVGDYGLKLVFYTDGYVYAKEEAIICSLDGTGGIVRFTKTMSHTASLVRVLTDILAGSLYGASDLDVEFTDAQLELKPYATTFTDGIRSSELPTIPTAGVLSAENGTVEAWVYTHSSQAQMTVPHVFRSDAGVNRLVLYTTLNIARFAGPGVYVATPNSLAEGWHFLVGWWHTEEGVTTIGLSVDGAPIGTAVCTGTPVIAASAGIGCIPTGGNCWNSKIDDLRISDIARSDAEILAAYQSNQPLPVDEHTTLKVSFDGSWQTVGMVFPRSAWQAMQTRLTLTKTGTAEQSLDSVALWEAVTLKIRGRPRVTLSPPEITHVKVYVEDSEPLVEYTASLDVRADQRVDHPPIAVPAGSSEAYCQQVAEAVLAAKSKERVSLQCVVPLVTRLRFGELVPVVLPYMGYSRDEPYLARVQKMQHDVLKGVTTLWLGDFLPEDEEALVRLLKGGK